jgi:putative sigma-54 modulation protein
MGGVMKITYTGRQVELAPAQWKRIDAQAAKLGKLLDGKDEGGAHVVVGFERGRHTAEITVNYHNHPLVGEASDQDVFTAIHSAIEKLEKQAIKVRAKWRDNKRAPRPRPVEPAPAAEPAEKRNGSARNSPTVYRVDNHQRHKPMTIDEAILEMEKDRDYLVYRDARNDRLSVLVRRRDGNFDLVEC